MSVKTTIITREIPSDAEVHANYRTGDHDLPEFGYLVYASGLTSGVTRLTFVTNDEGLLSLTRSDAFERRLLDSAKVVPAGYEVMAG